MEETSKLPPAGKRSRHPRLIVIVIVLIFAAPILSSWIVFHYGEFFGTGGQGHGEMYQPLRQIADAPLQDPFAESDTGAHLHGKWTLLYISPGQCDEVCQENIYRMRQIRLAVSRYAHRLQRVWMTEVSDIASARTLLEEFKGTLLLDLNGVRHSLALEQFALMDNEDPLEADHLYIIDPLGNLILRYRMDTDPVGIIKDLRRLLRNSRIG